MPSRSRSAQPNAIAGMRGRRRGAAVASTPRGRACPGEVGARADASPVSRPAALCSAASERTGAAPPVCAGTAKVGAGSTAAENRWSRSNGRIGASSGAAGVGRVSREKGCVEYGGAEEGNGGNGSIGANGRIRVASRSSSTTAELSSTPPGSASSPSRLTGLIPGARAGVASPAGAAVSSRGGAALAGSGREPVGLVCSGTSEMNPSAAPSALVAVPVPVGSASTATTGVGFVSVSSNNSASSNATVSSNATASASRASVPSLTDPCPSPDSLPPHSTPRPPALSS